MEQNYIQEFLECMPLLSLKSSPELSDRLYVQLRENPRIVEGIKSYHLTATYAIFYQYNKEILESEISYRTGASSAVFGNF